MDELREYELYLLCENLPWATKNLLEVTRMLMYSFTSPYMKKGQRKTLQEFLPLPTDELDRENKRLDGDEVNDIRNIIKGVFKQQG